MDFAVGLVVVAIAVLITNSSEGWSAPASGKYLMTVGALLAATVVSQGLGVVIDDSTGTRALIFIARLFLAGAIVVLVNGAVEAKRGGGPAAPPVQQQF